MKIALATPEFVLGNAFDGGLANYVYRIGKALQEQGHEPTIYTSGRKDEELIYDGLQVRNVRSAPLPGDNPGSVVQRFKKKISTVFEGKNAFTEELRKKSYWINQAILRDANRPDIIHYAHLGGLGFYRPEDIPCVARISSSTSLCHKFGGYGESSEDAIAQEKFENEALRKMDAVFGPSKMIGKLVSETIRKKVEIIETPFFMNTGQTDVSIYETRLRGKKYALFFGSIGLLKGAGTIANIIHDFLERNPDYFFVLVGKVLPRQDAGGDFLEFIRDKAADHRQRVIHIPPAQQDALIPIIRHAEFCVLPSRIDNFPNTCIEAMGNGKIVIGTRGNGFEQLIRNEESGFLVPVDDAQALLSTMNHVADLPPIQRNSLQENALARISLLAPELIIQHLLDFYRQAIRQHSKCAA